jgi:hypothetical protein
MNNLVIVSAFGVFLLLIGVAVEQLFHNGILAGMFGIWGTTAIGASILVFVGLRLAQLYEDRTALDFQ